MFKSFGVPELILILVIIFIFFGIGKLPQVGEQMGRAIRAFKKSQAGEDEKEQVTTNKSSAKKVPRSSRSSKTS